MSQLGNASCALTNREMDSFYAGSAAGMLLAGACGIGTEVRHLAGRR